MSLFPVYLACPPVGVNEGFLCLTTPSLSGPLVGFRFMGVSASKLSRLPTSVKARLVRLFSSSCFSLVLRSFLGFAAKSLQTGGAVPPFVAPSPSPAVGICCSFFDRT